MKWQKVVSFCVAGLGTVANCLLGGVDLALKTLLLFMFLDYITGLISAAKDGVLSSAIGFTGLLKKVMILIVITVAVHVDGVIDTRGLTRSLVIFFYVSMEGLSILENAARMNVLIPDELKDKLLQLKDGGKKQPKEDKDMAKDKSEKEGKRDKVNSND